MCSFAAAAAALFAKGLNAHASLGCHLRNAASHGASADDANDKIGSSGIEGHG